MKKLTRFLLLQAVIALVAPYAAMADMDYRCLNICMSNSGTAYTCNSQCSYNVPQTMTNKDKQKYNKNQELMKNGELGVKNGQLVTKRNSHKQFADLMVGKQIINNDPKQNDAPKTQKDYQCVTQCVQGGLMYGLCQEQCTKADMLVK